MSVKKCWVCCLSLVALSGWVAPDQCAADVFYRRVDGDKANDSINELSTDVSGPSGLKITSVTVVRRGPDGKPIDEGSGWKLNITQSSSGYHITEDRTTAAPVTTGVVVSLQITTNTNDTGLGGDDNKHQSDIEKRTDDAKKGKFLVRVDSIAYSGGDTGRFLPGLGITVPAHMYAYLYQVNNLVDSNGTADPLQQFRLANASAFTSFLVLSSSHDDSAIIGYHSTDPFGTDTAAPVYMFEGLGAAGVAPSSWSLVGDSAVASFSDLAPGQSSDILVAFSSVAPNIPDTENTFITSGSDTLSNILVAPVPEPSSLALLGTGAMAVIVIAWRDRSGKRRPFCGTTPEPCLAGDPVGLAV